MQNRSIKSYSWRLGLSKFSHISAFMREPSTGFLCQSAFKNLSSTHWSGQLLYTCRPCAPRSLHSLVDLPSDRLQEAFCMVVPFVRSATAQSRSFALVGPSTWNDLHQHLHLSHLNSYKISLFFS